MKRRQYLAGIGAAGAATITGVPTVMAQEDDAVAHWDVPEGTDVGPGNYTYPTTDEIPESEFDLAGFTIRSEDGRYHFTHEYHIGFSDPYGGDFGFSHQLIQIYLHNPNADEGTIEMREAVNATLEAPHHHRIVVAPFQDNLDPVVEDYEGNAVDEDVEVNTADGNKITVSVAESTLDYLEEGAVAVPSISADGFAAGLVRPVTEDGGEYQFGGAENEYAPNVIDLVTPDGISNEEALAYSDGEYAEIPFLQVDDDHDEEVADPNGDENGSENGDENGSENSDENGSENGDENGSENGDENGSENGDENGAENGEESDDDGSPGFGIGAALAGVAGGALASKRLGDDEE